MALSAGADIESICSKCGDVWHVIVAMVDTKIAKVQCKECNGVHRYKPPGGAAATRKKSVRPRSAAAKKASAPAVSAGPQVEADTSKPTRPYMASESFEVAERVDHIKFGIGVVEDAVPGKITVWFPTGRRVLAQAKVTRNLGRPKPFDHDDVPPGGGAG